MLLHLSKEIYIHKIQIKFKVMQEKFSHLNCYRAACSWQIIVLPCILFQKYKIVQNVKLQKIQNSACNTNVLISQCHIDSAYPWAKLNIQLTDFNAYTSL